MFAILGIFTFRQLCFIFASLILTLLTFSASHQIVSLISSIIEHFPSFEQQLLFLLYLALLPAVKAFILLQNSSFEC